MTSTPISSIRRTALPFLLIVTLTAASLFTPVTRVVGSSMPFKVGTVLKSVVFLYYPKAGAFEVGTGFLVEIPSKADPKRTSVVMVTARHIVDPKWAGCSWANPSALHALVNVKVQVRRDEEFRGRTPARLGRSGQAHLVCESEPAHRCGCASANGSTGRATPPKRRPLPARFGFRYGAETANYNVGIGDQIVTAGLVPALLDTQRNYPAFKFGRISNIPEEPINMVCTKGDKSEPRDVWLLAGNYVGGNNGSPVFLLPTPPAAHRVMLIGIIAGAIPEVDLGQMVPSESVFAIIAAHYPNANLYRGEAPPAPSRNRPAAANDVAVRSRHPKKEPLQRPGRSAAHFFFPSEDRTNSLTRASGRCARPRRSSAERRADTTRAESRARCRPRPAHRQRPSDCSRSSRLRPQTTKPK